MTYKFVLIRVFMLRVLSALCYWCSYIIDCDSTVTVRRFFSFLQRPWLGDDHTLTNSIAYSGSPSSDVLADVGDMTVSFTH